MTVKELKKEYKVIKLDGKYHIHVLGGLRSPYKYVGTVIKKGRSMYVEGYNPTTKIEKLKEQVDHYCKNLKYDSEYYSPLYRNGYKEYMIVYDYLDKLGFSCDSVKDGLHCELNRKSIFKNNITNISLSIYGLDYMKDELNDEVTVCLNLSNWSWVSNKCARNEDAIINSIDSFLKPLLISESAQNINTSKNMQTGEIDVILNKIQNLDIKTEDIKGYLKNQLMEIHNSL